MANWNKRHANEKYSDDEVQQVSYLSLVKRNRNQARHRGIVWNLTNEQAIEIFKSNCYYCGIEPSHYYNVYRTKAGRYISKHISRCDKAAILFNGIDRKDSTKNYSIDNVVPCCRTCNFAKNDLTQEEFNKWIKRICQKYAASVTNTDFYLPIFPNPIF